MRRPPYVFAVLFGVVVLVAGIVVYLRARPGLETANPEDPVANALGADDRARLPADRVPLPAADPAECRGVLVSGQSTWGVNGLTEKSVLWDEANRHLVVLLPNEKLTALQKKLTPT